MNAAQRAHRVMRRKWRGAYTHALARTPAAMLPGDWSAGPPDFVGMGVQKCGTSWWYQKIVAHPEVFRPAGALKEIHFFHGRAFGALTAREIERYHQLFRRPPGTITGEWTPVYMADLWTPSLLKEAAPGVRVLAILRDPIERYRSASTRFRAAFRRRGAMHRDAFAMGLYHSQLQRLVHVFGRERLLVLQLERCRDDPRAELRRTYGFLGIDDSFVPPALERVVNASWGAKVELPAHIVDLLRVGYREDARALARDYPEIDLGLWTTLGA